MLVELLVYPIFSSPVKWTSLAVKPHQNALLTNEQMYHADALTLQRGVSGFALMTRAAESVTDRAMELVTEQAPMRLPEQTRILVLCGKGNNGGDGFLSAQQLAGAGYNVEVVFLGTLNEYRLLTATDKSSAPDAVEACQAWTGSVSCCEIGQLPSGWDQNGPQQQYHLILDALLGAGLARALTGSGLALVKAVNTSGYPVLSVDIPTGVNGTTGTIVNTAIKADNTVTFFRRKQGHLLLPGRSYCGSTTVCDIGIDPEVLDQLGPIIVENTPSVFKHHIQPPELDAHKFNRGHALVISGSRHTTGAARLAAKAALRSGAGLVTMGSPEDALDINAMHLTEIMQLRIDAAADLIGVLDDQRLSSIVLGPGLGCSDQTRELVLAALSCHRATVLDADALTVFEQCSALLFDAIKRCKAPVVLTPHQGEFRRLFGTELQAQTPDPNTGQLSKCELAKRAAALSGAVVVYKGADTVIASPAGAQVISACAPAWLATAGSGDVLAGTIGGLLAGSYVRSQLRSQTGSHLETHSETGKDSLAEPLAENHDSQPTGDNTPDRQTQWQEIGFRLSCAGVWMHSKAASVHGPGLIASDIDRQYPQVLQELYSYSD